MGVLCFCTAFYLSYFPFGLYQSLSNISPHIHYAFLWFYICIVTSHNYAHWLVANNYNVPYLLGGNVHRDPCFLIGFAGNVTQPHPRTLLSTHWNIPASTAAVAMEVVQGHMAGPFQWAPVLCHCSPLSTAATPNVSVHLISTYLCCVGNLWTRVPPFDRFSVP